MTLILTSCAGLEARISSAARDGGNIRAGVSLAEWPDDCRRKEGHASMARGADARSVLKRERKALDLQNARTDRCSGFYDDQRRRMGAVDDRHG